MFRNSIKVAFRKLVAQKQFSFINVIGLSAGMAAALAIFYYVSFELSYEDFNPKASSVHRVVFNRTINGEVQTLANIPAPFKEVFLSNTSVESAVRFYSVDYQNSAFISQEDDVLRSFHFSGVYYTEANFTDLTGLPIAAGSREAFDQPKSMAITQHVADMLFPGMDPIGKTIRISNNVVEYDLVVRLVMEDLPENTDYPFQILISLQTLPMIEGDEVMVNDNFWNFRTYVELKEGVDKDQLSEELIGQIFTGEPKEGVTWSVDLIPVKEMHFQDYSMRATGNRTSLWALSIIGIFILSLAWINYINLTTTRALERAREVGVRKVMGATNAHLRWQFLGEAFLLNLIAALLAFTLVQAARPFLADIANPLVISAQQLPQFVLLCLAIILFGTLVSGLYPALVLSRYKSIDVMNGSFKSGRGKSIRRVLVVSQFAISVMLIIGTYVIYDQLTYMKNLELGMEINDLLILQSPPGKLDDEAFQNRAFSFKEKLGTMNSIAAICATSSVPGETISWGDSKIVRPGVDSDIIETKSLIAMDGEYFETLGIELVAGRFYNENDNTFSRGDIIINERASELFEFESPEAAIGQNLDGGRIFPEMTIRGVVKNSHHLSPRSEFEPTLYVLSIWANYYMVKLNVTASDPETRLTEVRSALDQLESEWQEYFPSAPFEYTFLDEKFDAQYKQEEKFSTLFTIFSVIAIFIAILGLFGLSAFDVFQRTKEIGIRKVLGASDASIIARLTRHYLSLVAISGCIAIPLSVLGAMKWQESFAYNSGLSVLVFVIPVILVVGLAAIVVVTQVYTAAQKNPVETLKYE